MRVALVAPPWHPVPPVGYGAVERMIAVLAEGLHDRGHDVFVYCQEGSTVRVPTRELFPTAGAGDLHTASQSQRLLTYQLRVSAAIAEEDVNVVHVFGNPEMATAAIAKPSCPLVATVQHPLTPAQVELLRELDDRMYPVSISPTHEQSAPAVPWEACILGTIDESSLSWPGPKQNFLLQLARISPDKGQDIAVRVAQRLEMPLVLGGFVGVGCGAYFDDMIRPWLGRGVTWEPDIQGNERTRLLSEAQAFLFPIRWDEPFGTAMAEAMASGTPVIATPQAAALDIVEPGVTGYFASSEDEFVTAVDTAQRIDPVACASRARERFGGDRFTLEYEALYERLLATKDQRQSKHTGDNSLVERNEVQPEDLCGDR